MKAELDDLSAPRESLGAFEAMAEATPTPVWITAASGKVRFVNRAFAQLTGKPAQELLNDAWISLLHPDDLPRVAERRAAAWSNNYEPYEFVARFADAAGNWRWMRASAQPRFDDTGGFQGYVGMAVDETAANKALEELRESESRLRLLQQAARVGSFDWDMRTGAIFRSPEYLAIQGLPPDAPLRGRYTDQWTERLHPEDRDRVVANFNEDISRVGPFEREYRIIRPDTGETRWIHNRGVIEPGADGKPARLLSAQTDITAHKETELALRAANEQLEMSVFERTWELQDAHGRAWQEERQRLKAEAASRAVAEQFRILVQGVVDYSLFLLSPEGRVSTWNAGAQRIKGYAADEIIGQHFSVFYTPEDREAGLPAQALRIARETGRHEKEGWRVRKDGARFMASVVIDAIHDDDGRLIGFAKITRDITEKVKAAQELEETRNALVQAQKMEMVGQLTGGLAHDFNNLLAGIIGALNLMQRRIDAGRVDDAEKYIDAALASAHRAASLTSRLLAFGRRQSLDIKPVDVAAAVRSMEILLARSVGENIKLRMQLAPAVAMTDANQLETAILNLAVNARDAMPNGGELTIETRAAHDRFVSVVVSDTGLGMAPDVLEKVFDPFFTTKPIGQGTGLGLSMVHGFVMQSGGDIGITSAPGRGTVVTLLLPIADRSPEAQKPREEAAIEGAGETVLVVEDDPQVRMLVFEVLSELGYNVLEADDARQALAILDRRRVDLLVSDVGLPGLNGRQLAEMARARAPRLKVLFMTGYAEHAQVRSSFLDDGMELITKPFEIEELGAKIREVMES
ncbi:MAG TPA: PAS domain S-box protein [Vitreimonas sp.]|uniref:PAS domain S-box protein n=1 Tax=Vitreimonas sp. TaxID=3069702 RepID=UPI002D3CD522|nr:PAS domain S-box protein [Vitreimonas sp.]HYD87796.1 PAS domain S-box protein [Vitreimonas sp.]